MSYTRVPVLITWDVDPDRWATAEHREQALARVLGLCQEFGIRSTFFFTANFAHEYPDYLERMQATGQEIGCHGLTHTDEEDYNRMPVDMQRTYIREATQKLEVVVGAPIRVFRSPRVKTSAHTLRLLAEQGYRADSSVCSQRVDFLSSNLINPGWLIAPRRPYHPHPDNAFRRGNVPIWELPVSALVVPFISGSLNVFGLGLTKLLFRWLYAESRRTGKPVIYLAHPPELVPSPHRGTRITLKHFSPAYIRTHGFLLRKIFYRMDGETWYNATRQLFAYIASFPGVAFMTGSEYVNDLEVHAATSST